MSNLDKHLANKWDGAWNEDGLSLAAPRRAARSLEERDDVGLNRRGRRGRRVALDHSAVLADEELGKVPLRRAQNGFERQPLAGQTSCAPEGSERRWRRAHARQELLNGTRLLCFVWLSSCEKGIGSSSVGSLCLERASLLCLDVAAKELALLLLEVLPQRVRVRAVHVHLPETARHANERSHWNSQPPWGCIHETSRFFSLPAASWAGQSHASKPKGPMTSHPLAPDLPPKRLGLCSRNLHPATVT